MKSSIKNFIQNISEINDPDYGDFMRKANHYLLDLEKELKEIAHERTQDHLNQMKEEIQFTPNWDIESTRQKVILEARMIDHELAAEEEEGKKEPATPLGAF